MTENVAKHTPIKTIVLHLFPGVIIAAVYFAFVPIIMRGGFPNVLANYIAVIIAIVPIEWGILLFVTKRKTGTYKISSQIPFLEKSGIKEYLIFIPIMAAWALVINQLLAPFEIGLRDTVFSFIPASYMIGNYDVSTFSREKIIFISIAGLICDGFVTPITEEFYFRGYLLPRINLPENKIFIVSSVLFPLSHFFSPWYFFSRVLMTLPLYYWVVKKKNIRFSILAHIIANSFASLSILLSLM